MKTILYLLFIVFLVGCQSAEKPSENQEQKQKAEVQANKSLTMNVDGMTCTGCEATIEGKLKGLAGVDSVKADHKNGITLVQYDSTIINRAAFVEAIQSTGYKVVEDKEILNK